MGGARSTRHSRDVSPRRAAIGARAGIRRIRHGRVREPRSVARALRTSETSCSINATMVPQPRWWPYATCTISMLGASRAAHVIEELEHPGWRCFLGLAGWEDVPVLGARQAFFEIPRRRGGVRLVAARNDQRGDIKAQQIFGLGARRGIPVDQRAAH